MGMEYKELLKKLLTVSTIVLVVVVPIWIGPETFVEKNLNLLEEWVLGAVRLVLIVLVVVFVCYIFSKVYEFWDDAIN